MDYPLAYYRKRNRSIVNEYVLQRKSVDSLAKKYELSEKRIRQILFDFRIQEPKERLKKGTPAEILQRCGLTRYKVRGALIRMGLL